MITIHVLCDYDGETQPIEIFSEMDDARNETRKIHLFPDGHRETASDGVEAENTALSREPLPDLDFINEQRIFRARSIPQDEFERAWNAAAPRA